MKRINYLIAIALFANFFFVFPTSAAQTITVNGETITIETPQPKIGIPGVEFGQAKFSTTGQGTQQIIDVPFLGQYLASIYKFAVTIAGLIAVVMIIVAGFQWATSGGSADAISSAKKRISDAVVGLLLVFGSYTILYTINPDLVQFKSLQIQYVRTENLNEISTIDEDEHELDNVEIQPSLGGENPVGINIKIDTNTESPKALKKDIESVAKKLLDENIGIYISSGFREPIVQKKLAKERCQNPEGPGSCVTLPGKNPACNGIKNIPADSVKCPHTSGRAIDIWAMTKNENGKWQTNRDIIKRCYSEKIFSACRTDPNHLAMTKAMLNRGFCVWWLKEPWHFEKPLLSKKNTSNGTKSMYCEEDIDDLERIAQ